MNELKDYISTIKLYGELADSFGDYKTADECYALLKEAEAISNNIRTASTKTAGGLFRGIGKAIKNIGRQIDRTVRKVVPGGWGTVIGLAAGPVLGKLAPALKGVGSKVLNFVASGGDPMSLLGPGVKPEVRQIANMFLQQAQTQGVQAGQGGMPVMTTDAGQPGAAQSGFAGLQTGTTPAYYQSPATTFLYIRNKAIQELNAIPDIKQRQAKYNELKSKLPGDIQRQIPEYSNSVQGLLKDIYSLSFPQNLQAK